MRAYSLVFLRQSTNHVFNPVVNVLNEPIADQTKTSKVCMLCDALWDALHVAAILVL